MAYKKLAVGIVVILLVAVTVAGSPAAVTDDRSAHGHPVQELALDIPVWQQVNSSGFGDPQRDEVTALETFNSYLYAGTHNPIDPEPVFDGAQIFRSPDGVSWTPVTQPGFGNTHDIAPPAILDFMVFKGYLYASTGRGNASQIWRSSNGTIWAPMDVTGFSDPDNVDIIALAEYGGKLYAGVTNQVSGVQIWSSFTGDNNSWTKQTTPAVPEMASSVTGFAVFDGALYAAVEFESDTPVQIWRSSGGNWTTEIGDGFGDNKNTLIGGMAVFGNYLYVGAGNTVNGAQLWRTNNGTTWTQAITPAFGDANNQKVEMVYVFQNQLYTSVKNTLTGIEIWRSTDGSVWTQVNEDGFGDSKNAGSNLSNAATDFLSQLHVGTSNIVDGGELWQMRQPFGVNLSSDNNLAGTAGQTINYTLSITNTGTMPDTFNLAAAGNAWMTNLSSSSIVLTPGAGGVFTATVTIPANAIGSATDTVTVTATSQGNNTVKDSVALTTKCIDLVPMIYLPVILRIP